MAKKTKIRLGILFVLILFVFVTGCDLTEKNSGGDGGSTDFKRGAAGLVMEFVPNYPGDNYILSDVDEDISIVIDLKNKGTYPEGDKFENGQIHISGFDNSIIEIEELSKSLSDKFLPAASPINPLGGFDTVEFDGKIIVDKITIDEYTPTILATACYPYATKASPTVCIDPQPFDDRQEKVCRIGGQTLETQGAPIAVTRVDQESSTKKIQFKITIKNVGDGDVLKPGDDIFDKCSPLAGEILDRKDFDRVQVKTIKIGEVDLLGDNKCSPFADNTANDDIKLMRLFNGEGFVICTLTVSELGSQSAYTTPLNIELVYNYRSTISKSIRISKLTSIG